MTTNFPTMNTITQAAATSGLAVYFVSLAVSSLSAVVVEFWSTWIRWLLI